MIRSLLVAAATAVAVSACSQPEAAGTDAAAAVAPPPALTPTPAMAAYTAKAAEYFSGGSAVAPAEVTMMIGAQGAQPTVAALGASGEKTRWTTVMAGVATGAPEWLALATPLEPGTENASYYDLNAALKAAMVVNPSGVLALLDEANPDLSAGAICYLDGIEMEPAEYAAYYDALTPAVESVTDPALAGRKTACLTILKAREGA